jgi:uncharacterized membrane protein
VVFGRCRRLEILKNCIHFASSKEGSVQHPVKPPRWAVIIFALALLFETWIWNRLTAALRVIVALIPWAQLKARIVAVIDLLPAPAALLLFVVPLVFVELMSFFSVVLFATGHFILGAVAYVGIKILGLGLVAAIFDLTRDKLMTMPNFVYCYQKVVAFHDYAHHLIEPYKQAARVYLAGVRDRAMAYLTRVPLDRPEKIER